MHKFPHKTTEIKGNSVLLHTSMYLKFIRKTKTIHVTKTVDYNNNTCTQKTYSTNENKEMKKSRTNWVKDCTKRGTFTTLNSCI